MDWRAVIRAWNDAVGDSCETSAAIARLLSDPLTGEAIFLASPALYDEAHRWLGGTLRPSEGARVKRSLLKYLIRMSTRATPFGLFAACSTGRFGAVRSGELSPDDQIRRVTRLDMNLVCMLSDRLVDTPDIRAHLRFFPNSTLYAVGRDVRYYEAWYDAKRKRHYRLVSVEGNPYLDRLLAAARNGTTLDSLARAIAGAEVTVEDAARYASDLVDNQVLTSELEPAITEPRFLDGLIEGMPPSPGGDTARAALAEVRSALQRIDETGRASAGDYDAVRATITRLVPDVSIENLFQVDAFRPATLTLDADVKARVMAGVAALNRLTPVAPNSRIERFRQEFRERFEDRQVPLLVALDADTGVPYGRRTTAPAPLLDGLDAAVPAGGDEGREARPAGPGERLLLARIWECLLSGRDEVRLTDQDLKALPLTWEDVPFSFSVWFSVVPIDGRDVLALYGAGAATAAAALGRFAHTDQGIHQQAEAATAHEAVQHYGKAGQHRGKVVAEVLHLPEDRVGNVLLHPPFRTYEIPCLARASVSPECVIRLDDLYLSVPHGGPLRLWSRRLGTEVVPALSHAHRYTAKELLPVYRLLGDLQAQSWRTSFHIPVETLLEGAPRLPRITYRDCILSTARWRFSGAELAGLLEHLKEPGTGLEAWRERQRLPREVLLMGDENGQYLDLSSPACRELLATELRGRTGATFSEFLFTGADQWIASGDGRYCHEIVASAFRTPEPGPGHD